MQDNQFFQNNQLSTDQSLAPVVPTVNTEEQIKINEARIKELENQLKLNRRDSIMLSKVQVKHLNRVEQFVQEGMKTGVACKKAGISPGYYYVLRSRRTKENKFGPIKNKYVKRPGKYVYRYDENEEFDLVGNILKSKKISSSTKKLVIKELLS